MVMRLSTTPLRLEYRGYNRVFINTIWFHARELSYSLSYVKARQPIGINL